MRKDRKFGAYFLGENDLLSLIQMGQGVYDQISIPVDRHIPKGAAIINISYSNMHMGWIIIFEHESFAPVPEGEKIPVLGGLKLCEPLVWYVKKGAD